MEKNVGVLDKSIRIVVGLALLSLLFFLEKPAGYFGLIGLVPLLTSFFGYCPLYKIVGLNTCPIKKTN